MYLRTDKQEENEVLEFNPFESYINDILAIGSELPIWGGTYVDDKENEALREHLVDPDLFFGCGI